MALSCYQTVSFVLSVATLFYSPVVVTRASQSHLEAICAVSLLYPGMFHTDKIVFALRYMTVSDVELCPSYLIH